MHETTQSQLPVEMIDGFGTTIIETVTQNDFCETMAKSRPLARRAEKSGLSARYIGGGVIQWRLAHLL